MREEEMTPRERWLAVLRHRKPDRVPMTYRATEETTRRLMEYLKCKSMNELYERLHIDRVIHVGPKYVGPPIPPDGDMFGCRYMKIKYGRGENAGVYRECVYHPLAKFKTVREIEKEYTWPSVDWFDYSVIPDQIKGYEDTHPISGGGCEVFLIYKRLRGEKQAYIDLYVNPEIVHYCLDKLFDFYYEHTRLIFEQIPGKIMISSVSEDLGSQTDLLYSPKHIREYFLPRMKRMMDLIHHYGAYVMTHSDGAIRRIIPDLIDIGMDILDPIQWRCRGMDRQELKRSFGDKIVFHGAMDNQRTLAFGSEEEIRQEVRDNIRILGEGGGYILGPCHNIQVITPPKHVVAMYDEGYKSGWY